jgi:hypothetical protein
MRIHLFPNGQVEVVARSRDRGRRCRPAYRWVPAYSQVSIRGISMSLPRREWYAMARRDGDRCQFHATEDDARRALFCDMGPVSAAYFGG